ncbi:hypothetical protein, partial [Chitinimonas sp. BJYL2]|uniref:toxin-antitoxin system YwqK family antitoxin n=1 Tax=Chitinimonas sp. BJYL2 TaxID=2976696 RepID=UPI0027E45C20
KRSVFQYENGLREGKYESHDENTGTVIASGQFVNNVLSGPFHEFNSAGKKTARYTMANGERNGPFERYDPQTGQVVESGSYEYNKLSGTVLRFNAEGKKIALNNYHFDVKEGLQQEFDPASGRIIQSATFINGQEVPGSGGVAEATTSCTDKWIVAHRKQVGEDAPISADQMTEWEDWCRVGKQP